MDLFYKNKFIMAVLIVLPLYNFSQNSIYKEEYNINTFLAPNKITMSKTIITNNNNYVYALSQNYSCKNNFLTINQFDIKSKKINVIKIKKEKNLNTLFAESIYSFVVTDNKIIFLTNSSIFIFLLNNGEYKLESTIANIKSFTKLYCLNSNEILLYVNYNFHPLDVQEKHLWAKLNLSNNQIYSHKIMDNQNVRFSYFVNDWISTYNGLIAYAQTTDYNIKIFNQDFNVIDSIVSEQLVNNKSYMKFISNGDEYSSDEMNEIKKADDTLLTRIQKIFLLDSTHILAILKLPNTKNMKFDIWHKNNNSWSLIQIDTLPYYYETGKKYDNFNNKITGFFGNFDGLTYLKNNEFYFFYFPFIENIISDSFDRKKDYDDKINELTREGKLYYGIKKISIIKY